MRRKQFIDNISDYCGNKKLKAPLGQLYKAMKIYVENENNDDSKQIDEVSNPKIINDLIKEIDEINDEILNQNKHKIIQYFKDNNIDYNELKNMGRKGFTNKIKAHCNDTSLTSKLAKLFKQMQKHMDDNIDIKDKSNAENVDTSKDNTQIVNNDENKNDENNDQNQDVNAMINILNKTICVLDNEKLNTHKHKIVEYFKINNINDIIFKNMRRKQFIDNISDYCGNKKLK
eukprot:301192_1